MFDLGAVVAHVKADISNFKEGIEKSQGLLGGFKTTATNIIGFAGKFGVALGAAGLAGAAAMKMFADVAGDAQKEVIRANTLLLQSVDGNVKKYKEFEEAVTDVSTAFIEFGFDDEETRVAMAKSLMVTKNVKESYKEMGLAADFARLQDIGIGEAQKILQMAYMGNARVLKQYGIELDDNATKTQIFAKIQDLAGGQAMAFADSYAGSVERFNVEFGNLREKIGEIFLPIVTEAFEAIRLFIYQLNSADFSWFNNAVQTVSSVFETLLPTIQNVINNIVMYFNQYFMPFILFWVEFIKAHWNDILIATQVVWDIITSIFVIATTIINATVITFLQNMLAWIKDHWTQIAEGTKGFWDVVVGLFQTATGIISIILAVFLGLFTGKWDEAWQKIFTASVQVWKGLENIFNGAVSFIRNWGGIILGELVRPFVDAWNRIQDYVKKIKDALDFTKRHSPSVVDLVKKGVNDVNRALSNLTYGGMVPEAAALTVSNGGASTRIHNITVDMAGAYITDRIGAKRIGEEIGDSIMAKLKQSVRF